MHDINDPEEDVPASRSANSASDGSDFRPEVDDEDEDGNPFEAVVGPEIETHMMGVLFVHFVLMRHHMLPE